jgi:hypothetical protein
VREEGGTPAIVEAIRAGLAFALKERVGAEEIRRRERDFARRALAAWSANPRIEILGGTRAERLPIVSLGLRHPPRLLHGNFAVALLSDLFGIQARGGCFCAGPYIHRMYPIDDAWSAAMDAECARGNVGAKLAFVRLGFNYFMSEAEFRYVLAAVELVADHGHRLLPLYRFEPASGLWQHRDARPAPTLADATAPPRARRSLAWQLGQARRILARAPAEAMPAPALSEEFERARWFPLPSG